MFNCVICLEENISTSKGYQTVKCDHLVCHACIRHYLDQSIKNPSFQIDRLECPVTGCSWQFDIDNLLKDVFNQTEINIWWSTALIQTFIKNKVYCPYKGCTAVFDCDQFKMCTFAECYECRRGFCVVCQEAWHPDKTYYDQAEEEAKLLKHAAKMMWSRCPKCKLLAEKISGCTTVYCVCGATFCYVCGGADYGHSCVNKCHIMKPDKLKTIRNTMLFNVQ